MQDYENKKCLFLNVDMHAATNGIVHIHMHSESKKWKDMGDLWIRIRHSISLLFLMHAHYLHLLTAHVHSLLWVHSPTNFVCIAIFRGKTRQRAPSFQAP